jgi:hypothetical protein
VKIPRYIDEQFWGEDRSSELPFIYNDSVRLKYQGSELCGAIVSIVRFVDQPKYLIELTDGSEVQATADQLFLLK